MIISVTGDKKKVMILLTVAILVLIIALVNFFNISSSQWLERIKQTGVLKIIGVSRFVLLINMLAEAFHFLSGGSADCRRSCKYNQSLDTRIIQEYTIVQI